MLVLPILEYFCYLYIFQCTLVGSNGIASRVLKTIHWIVFAFGTSFSILYIQIHFWWAQMESNHRPHAYQACALTI